MIIPVGVTMTKNTNPIIIGDIRTPKTVPIRSHNLFNGFNNLEFKIPKIRKISDKIKDHIIKSPLNFNGHNDIVKNTTKNSIPKLLLEENFVVPVIFILLKII